MIRPVPQWLFYLTIGVAMFFGLLLLFLWNGVIYDADVSISREGIMIFDVRPRTSRGMWGNMPADTAVDEVYQFLIQCIPLNEEDRKSMKGVSVVIVSERRLRVIVLLSLVPKDTSALYNPRLKRVYAVSTGDLAHELIHHYIARSPRIDPRKQHEHFLFSKCQSYDPAISFNYLP